MMLLDGFYMVTTSKQGVHWMEFQMEQGNALTYKLGWIRKKDERGCKEVCYTWVVGSSWISIFHCFNGHGGLTFSGIADGEKIGVKVTVNGGVKLTASLVCFPFVPQIFKGNIYYMETVRPSMIMLQNDDAKPFTFT